MAETPAPSAFVAWMAAETAAYTAIHQLHQRTQGGCLEIPSQRIEQIARLRKEADLRFAGLWGALGAATPQAGAVATAQPRRGRHRNFELRSRPAAEPRDNLGMA
ncbi:hypothetical protein M2282_004333 [Variovorax boronicumulans]|uniref:hypothetical protein n=1 Tax=Variovorax boronicumulans TaxID=436515 RepID=UPI002474FB69|nr:hypothetical protein [Variovorax boronicumulans]MDH6169169.1 hypothetical protein [Variovorax boronicumulans]